MKPLPKLCAGRNWTQLEGTTGLRFWNLGQIRFAIPIYKDGRSSSNRRVVDVDILHSASVVEHDPDSKSRAGPSWILA